MTHEDPQVRASAPVDAAQTAGAQDTRQGRPGRRILWLLIVSAGAAAILLLGMWFVSQNGMSQTNANDGGQVVDAQAFQGDSQTAPTADAPTTSTGEPTTPATGEAPNVNAPTTSVQPSN
ncbi:hypothetical protein [Brevundimonas sp. PAMC22021]|uniref:hypothetical protein n=1 Tax=Brevundimonas sp. PAMC22021 TaxID=2861285 RepID=UPI001C636757|nr:hypothetical protein [Brevundimonas sp. PAMC22021]QYF86910.1 hypothetical protein KY493_14110 [Brevundimonas sp. PAMC22021]